jgi:hypothetical protein
LSNGNTKIKLWIKCVDIKRNRAQKK